MIPSWEKFRHCETEIFPGKILFFHISSTIIFFATVNALKHSTEWYLCEFFRQCETALFPGEILTSPFLIHTFFRYRNFSETQRRRVPLRTFSATRDSKFSRESLDSPAPPLSVFIFATVKLLKDSIEGFPYEIFQHCDTKRLRPKNVIPPLLFTNFFAVRISLKHSTEGLRYESFRQC